MSDYLNQPLRSLEDMAAATQVEIDTLERQLSNLRRYEICSRSYSVTRTAGEIVERIWKLMERKQTINEEIARREQP